jgi:hypothetical protein
MIYVNPLMPCIRNKNWKYDYSSHLFTDGDIEKLHKFAESIGLKRAWFQNKKDLPHYDLTKNKRFQAIKNGAKECTNRFMAEIILKNRSLNQIPDKGKGE